MVMVGVLMQSGKLDIVITLLFAYAGTISEISLSYLLGKSLGNFFIHRYGRWIGITQPRLMKIHIWFEKLGTGLLIVGYFIPGIRHMTGFSAGLTNMAYGRFAFYAYTGAILWVSSFLSRLFCRDLLPLDV